MVAVGAEAKTPATMLRYPMRERRSTASHVGTALQSVPEAAGANAKVGGCVAREGEQLSDRKQRPCSTSAYAAGGIAHRVTHYRSRLHRQSAETHRPGKSAAMKDISRCKSYGRNHSLRIGSCRGGAE
eukprot:scaffold43425_cov36-Tisochrysis_lutea.AAC.1